MFGTQKMKVQVFGASIYRDAERDKVYSKLLVGQMAEASNSNSKGIEFMQVNCDEQVYLDLDAPKYPCNAELEVNLVKGGQNTMKQHVVGLKVMEQAARAPVTKS